MKQRFITPFEAMSVFAKLADLRVNGIGGFFIENTEVHLFRNNKKSIQHFRLFLDTPEREICKFFNVLYDSSKTF